jgi:hypothetical protein
VGRPVDVELPELEPASLLEDQHVMGDGLPHQLGQLAGQLEEGGHGGEGGVGV